MRQDRRRSKSILRRCAGSSRDCQVSSTWRRGTAVADITALILADHQWFREQFAKLDELQARRSVNTAGLKRVWGPLADKLDVHAYIEEKIFYPQLLERGANDPEGETLDAIGDHNDIRDGVREANAAAVVSEEWWAAVGRIGWRMT